MFMTSCQSLIITYVGLYVCWSYHLQQSLYLGNYPHNRPIHGIGICVNRDLSAFLYVFLENILLLVFA